MAKSPSDISKYQKHFDSQTFLEKAGKIVKKAGEKVIYLALILFYEISDPSVPVSQKGILIGALGYLLLPLDLIPDFIPIAGYADDFTALIAAYRTVRDNITPEVRKKALDKMHEWFGNIDQSSLDSQIEDAAEEPDEQ